METVNKTFPAFLSGGGEMGERIRNFDWDSTPLGDPVDWEESLKTCVRIMLSSTQPIWIGWGKELIKLYNDPYKAIVGGKHPHALGKPASEVWKDIWHDIEPLLKQAMEKDKGTYVESQLLIMERYGYAEETYYTFSYTPVLGNDLRPAGIICYNTADTERIINERALKTLRQLDALAQKKTEQEVYEQAALAIAGNNRDFPFATFYKIEDEGNLAILVAYAGFKIRETEHPEKINLQKNGDSFKNLAVAINENKTVLSKNNGRWKTLPKGTWDIMPESFVHLPIKTANNKFPLAILTLGLNPYRKFDDTYRNFVQQIADQVTLSINNVRAYEEERKRNEALKELDKAKTIFFTNISHELRTPLTLMLGTMEETIQDPNTIPANLDRLNMAHRNALRLLKLVNNLLDFSLIESGRQKAHFVITNVEILTKNLAASFRSALEKAGLEFLINIHPITQPVYIDRQMWEKIVFNLLSNAFKYTITGSIEINVFPQSSHMVLEVKDSGIGIPQKELPHIFERFHRVQTYGGRTYEGTGIGLSLVKELVQMHGGAINVQSEEGKGTVFTVTLPFGKAHLPETQVFEVDDKQSDLLPFDYIDGGEILGFSARNNNSAKKSNVQIAGNESTSVLVVDDNADMRDHLQSILEQYFTVITAENGKDALEKIKSFTPSLILSDIMMPVVDGIQLLEKIKSNRETEQIPVILLTARAGEESRIEGYEIGADDYLVKPFSAKELLARVRSQIKIAKTRKHLQTQLRDFFMEAPAGIGVVKGEKHVWEIVNKRMLELVGRKNSNELLNKPLFESIPEGAGQGFEVILDNVYRTGQRFILEEAPAELFRNGKLEKFYVRVLFEPLHEEDGAVSGVMFLGDDITEQVIARKKIEESESRFRSMANEAPIFVWVTDEKLQTTFLNKTGLIYFGLHEDTDFSKLSWKKFIHPEDIDRVLSVMRNAADKHATYSLEMRLRNEVGGEYRWFMDKGVPRYENNIFTGFIGTSLDIHDQKIKEEAKDEFISITGHELKTPLTSAKAFIQMAQSVLRNDADSSLLFVEKANKSIEKLNTLISELLDLSRIQNGKLLLNMSTFNFDEMLSTVIESVQPTIAKHTIIRTGTCDVQITGDSERLQQVIINLLNNAAKYSPGEHEVFVHTAIENNKIKIFVRDNGIGIAKNNIDKIFQRFFRVDETGKQFHGLGIGLYVAQDIIHRHRGKIFVESELGKGSTFIVELPLQQ